jgi:hypothetical protein
MQFGQMKLLKKIVLIFLMSFFVIRYINNFLIILILACFQKCFVGWVATEDVNDWVSPLEAEEITYLLVLLKILILKMMKLLDITWTFGFAEVIYHQFTII